MHSLVGGGGQHGCYDALDYRKIKHANAGLLGTYPIVSVLPAKFARFLFEFHSGRFESLDLPILPDDRSQFDVHSALEDDKVKQLEYTSHIEYIRCTLFILLYHLYHLNQLCRLTKYFYLSDSHYSYVDNYCKIVHYVCGPAIRSYPKDSVDSCSRPTDSSNCLVKNC